MSDEKPLGGYPPELVLKLLEDLQQFGEVSKITSTFIPAFYEKSVSMGAVKYLHGSFNLPGTISGRQSSSDPNLTQLPSTGTQFAKPIKEIFEAPFGWLIVGADFNSLEDMISALTTKDPNKLAVYEQGYDGHCLRAFAYFESEMGDIAKEIERDPKRKVELINSISKRYGKLRQHSKGPTFALTYAGTWRTLVANFGLTEDEAQRIEKAYHTLYSVSDAWVQERLEQATIDGFVTLAFGLRLRTPILSQIVWGSDRHLPKEAHKEMKSAGNALGQSYGLLNTRAANAFMEEVHASKYREDILPIMQIHDSQYYMIKDRMEVILWVNEHLIKHMTWDKLPEIQHPVVKLGANLEVYWPTWAHPLKLPNNCTKEELIALAAKHKENLREKPPAFRRAHP